MVRRLELTLRDEPPTPEQRAAWLRLVARIAGPLTGRADSGNLGENVREASA